MAILFAEPGAKQRGDLFARLVADYLLSLGYDNFRFGVAKPGCEIDVIAEHRTERRTLRAECKAEKDRIGGSDVNKFAGVLDGERRTSDGVIEGYFLSLAGFTESAIQQEQAYDPARLILVSGATVAESLEQFRLVPSAATAVDLVARALVDAPDAEKVFADAADLLLHQTGWYRVLRYRSQDGEIRHFALVHSDGYVASASLLASIMESDAAQAGYFRGLTPLPAPPPEGEFLARVQRTKEAYFSYLRAECGIVTFEGLPADQEVGTRKVDLDDLFVPLFLEPTLNGPPDIGSPLTRVSDAEWNNSDRLDVATVVAKDRKIAVLGMPGAGKSTLLKHLALAYIDAHEPDPKEHTNAEGALSTRLPIFVRCRQIEMSSGVTILDVVRDIVRRAEIPFYAEEFDHLVKDALRTGTCVLLIDGLDEIADPGERVAFAIQLRTFLAQYPSAAAVVTSRQRGFRVVAPALASVCMPYSLAPLAAPEIVQLINAWFSQLPGMTGDSAAQASSTASTILENERLTLLAGNPLLLTTLLLVRRWAGDLPKRRVALYDKAIEVLLTTWNVQGHQPLDLDEALPQLAYLAYAMTCSGVRVASASWIKETLNRSRVDMPDVLADTAMGVGEFLQRVEDRSSLLSLSGFDMSSGRIDEVYEFKHLTFQEYLTALAIVERFGPPVASGDPWQILVDRLGDSSWTEIVPLAAVLSGRAGSEIARRLLGRTAHLGAAPPPRGSEPGGAFAEVDQSEAESTDPFINAMSVLRSCLSDEVQLLPDVASAVCREVVRFGVDEEDSSPIRSILAGRYGSMFAEEAEDWFQHAERPIDIRDASQALSQVASYQLGFPQYSEPADVRGAVARIIEMFRGADLERAKAALGTMQLSYTLSGGFGRDPSADDYGAEWSAIWDALAAALERANAPRLRFTAAWALAWLSVCQPNSAPEAVVASCFKLLVEEAVSAEEDDYFDYSRFFEWAFTNLPPVSTSKLPRLDVNPDMVSSYVETCLRSEGLQHDSLGRLRAVETLARYFPDVVSSEVVADNTVRRMEATTQEYLLMQGRSLLERLGPAGERALEEYTRRLRVADAAASA